MRGQAEDRTKVPLTVETLQPGARIQPGLAPTNLNGNLAAVRSKPATLAAGLKMTKAAG